MDVLNRILEVFDMIGQWIPDAINGLIPLFYTAPTGDAEGTLTFLGVLAVAGLSISVVFLLINVISSFLNFRS